MTTATESTLPVLETPRLCLRGFDPVDAAAVRRLAGDPLVAATTLNVPHPYRKGMAQSWIATHGTEWIRGQQVVLAITLRDGGELVGAVALTLKRAHARAELGYWIGRRHWGRGYATEAARALVDYAFDELGVERVHAYHFDGNEASARVLDKVGMRYEGTLRAHVIKDGERRDLVVRGILRSEDGRAERR